MTDTKCEACDGHGWNIPADNEVICACDQCDRFVRDLDAADEVRHLARTQPGLLDACKPVIQAVEQSQCGDFRADDYNPDAHVEITLSIGEAKALDAALAKAGK